MFGVSGAQERTRTSTSIQTPAPEAGASTNSATWAGHVSAGFKDGCALCQSDSRVKSEHSGNSGALRLVWPVERR